MTAVIELLHERGKQSDAIAGVQAKGGGGLGRDGYRGGDEKPLDTGYILMRDPVGFANEL